ncbi:hypothetical protein [Streptomyces sp. NPDC058307]|uniref:hypothetical protein n=1 Tax=Streptomyces sp. NPDC058307 TaxID=3346439 RepID=UPI0036EBB721
MIDKEEAMAFVQAGAPASVEPTLPNAFWNHFTSTLAPVVEKEFGDHVVTEIQITLILPDESVPYVGRALVDVELWFRWCMRLDELVRDYPESPPPVHLTHPSKMQFSVISVERSSPLKITLKASPRDIYYTLRSVLVALEILRVVAGGSVANFVLEGPPDAPTRSEIPGYRIPEPPSEVKEQEQALWGLRPGGDPGQGAPGNIIVKLSNGQTLSCNFTMTVRPFDPDTKLISDIAVACVQFHQQEEQ